MRKIIAFVLPMVMIAGMLSGCVFGIGDSAAEVMASYGYVSVDINPSVQFITDEDDNVVGVTAGNDDGATILLGEIEALLGMDTDALETDPSAVSISAMKSGGSEATENAFRYKIESRVQNFFKNNGIFGVVITDEDMDDQLVGEQLVNPAKLKLIESTMRATPEMTMEQAMNMSAEQLMVQLREAKNFEARLHEYEDRLTEINLDLEELNAELAPLLTALTDKEAELVALNLVDITLLDEADLAAQLKQCKLRLM